MEPTFLFILVERGAKLNMYIFFNSRLAAGWLTPLFSYSPYMWIAVGTVFFTCILILFCLHYFYNKTMGQPTR